MKNIHVLPTDKSSNLFKDIKNKLMFNKEWIELPIGRVNQNIYITSDEEIKANVYALINGVLCKTEIKEGKIVSRQLSGGATMDICKTEYLEIILTTNQDLIKNGVQAIDDTFLEWFVKNPSCEEIRVLNKVDFFSKVNDKLIYKIITPQEELKQSNNFYEELKHYFETTPREKVLKDWNESVELDKIGPTVEEFLGMIQETIEEAAEKYRDYWLETRGLTLTDTFIAGAKWQEKRMYSEEEVVNLIEDWTKMAEGLNLNFPSGKFNNWFEQFKKK
jgi:hypothetical protein